MTDPETRSLLDQVASYASGFLESLPDRPVGSSATLEEMRDALDSPLPVDGLDASTLIKDLATAAEPGLVATPSGRFFGFVIGGAM
ncbi:MAG: aspartate aminotransferase family protein, partial [Actinomycetota bacterium]|nr:aspartate aminotransferase family protein [Actinomycetota bacterium]